MRIRIASGIIKNHITKWVSPSTTSTRRELTYLQSVLDTKITTSNLQVAFNVPRGNFHIAVCISSEKENKVPWAKYFSDSVTAITVTKMDGEEKSTANLNTKKTVENERKQSHKESDVNDKNKDVLMKQEKDLADYRKRQRERWRKSNVGSKAEPSKELSENAQKSHKHVKEWKDRTRNIQKSDRHARERKDRTRDVVQDVSFPTTSRQDTRKSDKHAREQKDRTRDIVHDVSFPTTSRQDTRKSDKHAREQKDRTRDIVHDVSFPTTSRQDTRKSDRHAKERKDRTRDIVHEVAFPTTSRQDIRKSDKHARERKDRTHNVVHDVSSPRSYQEDAEKGDVYANEQKDGNRNLVQDASSSTSSSNKKRRKKRQHRASEGETPDKKRVSLDNKERPEMSCSPDVIDLDPVYINDSPSTVTNGDILEIQDMDLATSDDEDIVLLAPSPRPGTSSEGLLKTEQGETKEKEDDVMYMGTVINLVDSPPTQSSESSTLPSSSHCEVTSNPFVPGSGSLYPRASPAEDTSYHYLQQQQLPVMPYSATNPYMYSSTSSSMAYSTASSGFHTVSASFSRFMTAATFGNAIPPSHLGFPNSSQTYGGYGQAVSGNTWPQRSMGFGQQTASFHQSTETAARRDNSSPVQDRTQSPYRRASHKQNRTKLRDRKWLLVDEELEESQGLMNFTVASYNILAQNLLDDNSQLYDGSEQKYLNWGYRSRNLLEEIEQYCPDILCLQEVKEDHYHRHFKPRLESIGYYGCYKKRTREMQDGCATFFKTDKFELDICKPLEYFTRGTSVLDRDNVALLVRLIPRDKSTNNKIVVANTHLLFNPRRGDVKLAQLVLMLAEVDRLAYCGKPGINPLSPIYHPTLIMGDFNSEPQSPLYQLLASGNVEYVGQPMNLFSGQSEGRRGTFKVFDNTVLPRKLKVTDFCQHEDDVRKRFSCWDSAREGADSIDHGRLWGSHNSSSQHTLTHVDLLQHDCGTYRTFLPLCSVYKHHTFSMERQRREKEVTTHHGYSKCTVDYIFYASGSRGVTQTQNQQLRLVRRLELLTEPEMKKFGPLPNREVSSDHTLLGAAFQLRL